jgi:predicted  nucleic acid-binding Zn-ribbon protein
VARELADARRIGFARGAIAENEIIAAALTGNGPRADEQLGVYIEESRSQAADVREQNVHRATGLAALANGKYDEAIAHLKQGGPNLWVEVGTIEALTTLGKRK